ncbi:hypothetical protein C0995_004527 [Termitomyces sp. Mi166|nr:hypothetical protein C0995_004527 [Termitomyces sp. Mi166\
MPSTSGQASGTLPILGEDGTDDYRYTGTSLEIPDSLVLHVIRHQGRGLKQAHDLSSSQLATFVVGPAGNKECQFVTIRSTDQQIGEALVVIGKHIAKCRVHAPQKQKTGNAAPRVAALAPSPSDLGSVLSTPKSPIQQT